ncbi:Bcr/CflA family multidrug efflux MFS transporter [Dechloromonas sp. XY25]|uniref:Bcr/CflA family efflux transporter n=1 Tax=Dechloromonas hankyongensis TaxID=2908002 RepID=A0ABS9K7P6_9RHOO|nr:Bcr/CflA family multidrug efflux MFS transporter [Dechloromonas hankyongensis]MCG2579197.1 Bcr/CflA family multidrug efflux MFS transporter [Dechloromonas hankyongensis]
MTTPTTEPAREGRFILLLGALVAFGPLAIDLYLPALPAIAAGLSASAEAVQSSITVFLAGFAVGMLFYGPISDRYGRRTVMLTGIALFALASLACLLSTAIEQLILARFVQALGGGAASVLARAVVRDVYAPSEAIRKLSLMATVTAIAPLLAPLLGSALLAGFGWRGTFAAVLAWGLLSLAVVWRLLPETLPAERRGELSLAAAFAAYGRLALDPVAIGLLLAGGMSFAAMFAYITASPFYFIALQKLSPTAYGALFAANALGIFAANYANSRLVKSRGAAAMAGVGCASGFTGALLLWVAIAGDALPAVIAGLFVVVSMTGLLGANCVGLLMARYPQNAGAAAALFGSSQFGFGMWASAAVSYTHDGSGRPMAWVIVATMTLSVLGYLLYRRAAR